MNVSIGIMICLAVWSEAIQTFAKEWFLLYSMYLKVFKDTLYSSVSRGNVILQSLAAHRGNSTPYVVCSADNTDQF